jgi:hypothetical protein
MRTFGIVLFFATVGFCAGWLLVDRAFQSYGPLGAFVSFIVIPFTTVAGGLFGYCIAQKLWG